MWLQARVGWLAYDFLPLTSIAAIAEEARGHEELPERPMATSLAHNRSRLWSVRLNGERVATLKDCLPLS